MAKPLPRLTITVEASGATTTDFLHFVGANCLATSQQLHALLAEYGIVAEVTSITPKPELLTAPRDPEQQVHNEQIVEGGC
jgi:hypothetical protein